MPKSSKVRYAGFWRRFLAVVILDVLIIWIPVLIVSFILVYLTSIDTLFWLFYLAGIIFVIYMEGIHGGTPGKLILGLRIVNEKGKFIGIPNAILRYVSQMLSAIIFGVGYLMIAWDPKKQGLHDKIAKTYVVYVR